MHGTLYLPGINVAPGIITPKMGAEFGGENYLMKRFNSPLLILLLSLATAASQAGDKPGSTHAASYEFAFGKEPLVYSVHQKSETKSVVSNPSSYSSGAPYANAPAPGVTTKTIVDIHFKFRLTTMGTTKDGLTTVRYEPFDYLSDTESSGPSGRFVTSTRGLSVKSTQNGIVIIDTDKEIGYSQAKGLKAEIIPSLLSGTFDINSSGDVVAIHGDLPFVDAWTEQEKMQIGLFGFRLAGHAVTNGETWEAVLPMKSAGPIKFEGSPLNHTNYFTLVDDAATDNPSLTTLKLSAPMISRDLGGYIEERGQSTHADLSEFEIHAFGMIHFDKKRRIFIDEDLSRSVSMSMTLLVQGRAMTSRTELHSEIQMDLVPASADSADEQKPAGRKSL
jgi:hypothetical protein